LELETTIQVLGDISIKIYRLIKILSNSTASINWLTGITRQALVKGFFPSIGSAKFLPISISGKKSHVDLRIEEFMLWLILILLGIIDL
jgi:hypothetical protein